MSRGIFEEAGNDFLEHHPITALCIVIALLFILIGLGVRKKYFTKPEQGEVLSHERILQEISKIDKTGGYLIITNLDNTDLLCEDAYSMPINYRPANEMGRFLEDINIPIDNDLVPRLEFELMGSWSRNRKYKNIILNFAKIHNLSSKTYRGRYANLINCPSVHITFPKDLSTSSKLIFSLAKDLYGPETNRYKFKITDRKLGYGSLSGT